MSFQSNDKLNQCQNLTDYSKLKVFFFHLLNEMNAESNVKLCKTSDLSDERDILTIKEYVIRRTNGITKDPFHSMRVHSYVELCNCNITRLILFNGYQRGVT